MSGILVAVGFVGLLIAFLGALGFILMKMKGGRIANTPFHSTGDVASKGASVAGPKGEISTEGKLIQPEELLTSPVEGKPCLMYTLEVHAKWKAGDNEVSVQMMEEKKSIIFEIDDGSGPIKVDPGTSGDFEPLHKFDETKGKGLKSAFTGGGIKFGATEFEVHPGGRYKGKLVPDNAKIKVVEKALEPQAMFYANGKLEDGVIQKHSWSSLILSNKSRDETLAATMKTQNNAKMAAIGGGVIGPICLGIGMALAPAPDAKEDTKAPVAQEEAAPAAEKKAEPKSAPAKKSAPEKAAEPAAVPEASGSAAPAGGGAGAGAGGGRPGGKAGGPRGGAGKGGKRKR
jgi:hypothetical protein